MRNIKACFYVSPADRAKLEQFVSDGKTPQKIAADASLAAVPGTGFPGRLASAAAHDGRWP